MVYISFNIVGPNGTLNNSPFLDYYDDFKTFSNLIRSWCDDSTFVEWSNYYHISSKRLKLYVSIIQEIDTEMVYCKEFTLNLCNIREYEKWIGLSWDEIESEIISIKRLEKINKIL